MRKLATMIWTERRNTERSSDRARPPDAIGPADHHR